MSLSEKYLYECVKVARQGRNAVIHVKLVQEGGFLIGKGRPYIGRAFDDNWGLPDPTGQPDENFRETIDQIEKQILQLMRHIQGGACTIHEAGVRNRPDFSDKLVEDWRWQKR